MSHKRGMKFNVYFARRATKNQGFRTFWRSAKKNTGLHQPILGHNYALGYRLIGGEGAWAPRHEPPKGDAFTKPAAWSRAHLPNFISDSS